MPEFTEATLPAILLACNPIANGATAFRRQDALAIGGADTSLALSSDYDFYLRLAWNRAKFAVLDQVLYVYRVHEGCVSVNKSSLQEECAARAQLSIVRRLRDDPSAFEWVRCEVLRAALSRLVRRWLSDGRRLAAREAACAILLLDRWSVRGYGLWAMTAPGGALLHRMARKLEKSMGRERRMW